ncbi:Peptide-methionine (S)-S-oxide reductase, partial [Serendipita sp. 400]
MLTRLFAIKQSLLSSLTTTTATRSASSASRIMSDDSGNENIATFAAGCFWGVEHIFNKYFPDLKTSVGYSNGKENISNPSYRQV